MLTVQQVADKYGVSVAFMLAALAKIGFHATGADTPLPPPIVNQFAVKWATKIHMNRPNQPTEFQGVSDPRCPLTLSLPVPRGRRQSTSCAWLTPASLEVATRRATR